MNNVSLRISACVLLALLPLASTAQTAAPQSAPASSTQNKKSAAEAAELRAKNARAYYEAKGNKPLLNSPIRVLDAWAYAVEKPGVMAKIYLSLRNDSTSPDTFLTASVDPKVAKSAQLYDSVMQDKKLTARKLLGIGLPQGKTISFTPTNNMYVGVEELKKPMKAGEYVLLKLEFATAPPAEVLVEIRKDPAAEKALTKAPAKNTKTEKTAPKSQH